MASRHLYGLSGLKFESRQDVAVALLIDVPFDGSSIAERILRLLCALVMRVVDVLDDRFSRVQDMRVRHVVEKEKQIVRTVLPTVRRIFCTAGGYCPMISGSRAMVRSMPIACDRRDAIVPSRFPRMTQARDRSDCP